MYDDELELDEAFCSNWMSCCSTSAAEVVEPELDDESLESLEDESSEGGGPGGGPPAPDGSGG